MTDKYLNYPSPVCSGPVEASFKGTRLCDVLTKEKELTVLSLLVTYLNTKKNYAIMTPEQAAEKPENVALSYDGFVMSWKYNLCKAGVNCCSTCNGLAECSQKLIAFEDPTNLLGGTVNMVGMGCAVAGALLCAGCDIRFNTSLSLPVMSSKKGFDNIITGIEVSIDDEGINRLTAICYCPILRYNNDYNVSEGKYDYYIIDSEGSGSTYNIGDGISINRAATINNNEDKTLGNYNATNKVGIFPFKTFPNKTYGLSGIGYRINDKGVKSITDLWLIFTSFINGDKLIYHINHKNSSPTIYTDINDPNIPIKDTTVVWLITDDDKKYIRQILWTAANYQTGGGLKGALNIVIQDFRKLYDALLKTNYHQCCTIEPDDSYSADSVEAYQCYTQRYTTDRTGTDIVYSPNCKNDWAAYCDQDKFNKDTEEQDCRRYCKNSNVNCDNLITGYCNTLIMKDLIINITPQDNTISLNLKNEATSVITPVNIVVAEGEYSIYNLINRINMSPVISNLPPINKQTALNFEVFPLDNNYAISITTPKLKYDMNNEIGDNYLISINKTPLSDILGFDSYGQYQYMILSVKPINGKASEMKIPYIKIIDGDVLKLIVYKSPSIFNTYSTNLKPGEYSPLDILKNLQEVIQKADDTDKISTFFGYKGLQIESQKVIQMVDTPLAKRLGFYDLEPTDKKDPKNRLLKSDPTKTEYSYNYLYDTDKLIKDKVCGCFIPSFPPSLNKVDDIDSLTEFGKTHIQPTDAIRVYTKRYLGINEVDDPDYRYECLSPNCFKSQYKFSNYRKNPPVCNSKLDCIRNGSVVIDLQNTNEGAETRCMSDARGCISPYIPDIFILPKSSPECFDLLKEKDTDCVVSNKPSPSGECGEDIPEKQAMVFNIIQYNTGNGKTCPSRNTRTFYLNCIKPTMSDSTKIRSTGTYVIIVLFGLVLLFGLYKLFVKIFIK